jgi:L-asparagine transporter-like permease
MRAASIGLSREARPAPAINQTRVQQFSMVSFLVFIILLILPVIAMLHQNVDWRWTVIYAVAVNLLTYWTYARDKRRAENSEWRVPEIRLHLLELLSGWPAAFLAQ